MQNQKEEKKQMYQKMDSPKKIIFNMRKISFQFFFFFCELT